MYNITIVSKNKKSITNIFKILNTINYQKNLRTNTIEKYIQKKNKKKLLTVLKSPHVNKTAQEQFEFKYFYKQLLIKTTTQNLKFVLVLKKIESHLLSDIKILVKFINNKKVDKIFSNIFCRTNFKIKQHNSKNIKKIININDIYGELSLKNQKF